jgi:hypothetical protein
MAFKMKYKNLEEVVKQLRSAVVAHGKQADTIEKHVKDMEKSPLNKKKGLWDNIHAKRKRGESPAKPGDKDYPTDKALKESQTPLNKKCTCWEGYERVPGTKKCAPGSCRKK